MQTYEKLKHSILKYQKTSKKYKVYKKEYDSDYYKSNKLYASFRATKSRLYKLYDKETAQTLLIAYLLKQKTKGYDINCFIDKVVYC